MAMTTATASRIEGTSHHSSPPPLVALVSVAVSSSVVSSSVLSSAASVVERSARMVQSSIRFSSSARSATISS